MPSSLLTCKPLTTSHHLQASSTISTSPPPPQEQPRRPRRVLYPAFQSRKPTLKEAPDLALRCLLLLSVLLFLQIYTEDAHSCTELQNHSPDLAVCYPQQADGSIAAAQGWKKEEPQKLWIELGSEHQMCVVV
ncbi:unnamed protein product [Ophioblennius macclurei]